jgi:hypothetical protein
MKDFKHLANPQLKRSSFDRYLIVECLMIAGLMVFGWSQLPGGAA